MLTEWITRLAGKQCPLLTMISEILLEEKYRKWTSSTQQMARNPSLSLLSCSLFFTFLPLCLHVSAKRFIQSCSKHFWFDPCAISTAFGRHRSLLQPAKGLHPSSNRSVWRLGRLVPERLILRARLSRSMLNVSSIPSKFV